jgi:hypothetical protein
MIEESNVRPMTKTADKVEVKLVLSDDASAMVTRLESHGGDLDLLLAEYTETPLLTLYKIEKLLAAHKDAKLKERWDEAIATFHASAMRLLQRDAVNRLQDLDDSDEKASRIVLGYAKLILGDLFAEKITLARAGAKTPKRSSNLATIQNDLEDGDEEGE